jgi:hypothetical protein
MDLVVSVLITLLILGALVGGIVGGYIWLKRLAMAAQERAFSGLAIFSEPKPELVTVVFHTYYGFLVYFVQTEYRFWATPDEARIALWRLHRFNLIWGLFAAGAIFIPLFSMGNYWAQLRSIRKQIEQRSPQTTN